MELDSDIFKFILDNAGEEFYLVRPDGSLAYVNKAAASSIGYSRKELSSMGVPDFDPIFGPKFKQHFDMLKKAATGMDVIFHLAGQVAVTSSVKHPRQDFESNALGTFNALEAARLVGNDPIFVFASTNKVYGGMEEVNVVEKSTRYCYADLPFGIPETQPIDFHSPYGCSKGGADQYIIDYARIFGLKTVVFRQSCIYGTRQFGIEDQGWVSWFVIATTLNKPLKIFGNGKQVRDVLFVEDLIKCYELAIENIDKTSGNAYNIGGGPNYCMSLLELINYLEEFHGKKIEYSYVY